jgi:hypothetical protein
MVSGHRYIEDVAAACQPRTSPGPDGFASTATGLAVLVLETGKGGGKDGASGDMFRLERSGTCPLSELTLSLAPANGSNGEGEKERLAVIGGNYKFKGDMKEGNLLLYTASEAKRCYKYSRNI